MHALRSAWVIYERRTETRDGHRSVVYERGSQLVWQDRLGIDAPIDDEEPLVGDYSFQREDTDGVDEHGVRYGIERLVRRPRHVPGGASRPGWEPPAVRAAGVVASVLGGEGNTPPCDCVGSSFDATPRRVRVLLRDPPTAPVPSLGTCAAADALGAGDRLRRLRVERIAARASARQVLGETVSAEVARLGGAATRVRTGHGFSVEATLPEGALASLAADPRVIGVLPATRPEGRPDGLDPSCLCTGLPSGMRLDVDSEPCAAYALSRAGSTVLSLGGKVAAGGAYAYLEQGYTGAGGYGLGRSAEGGLSPWALMWDVASEGGAVDMLARVPHVTIGILDPNGIDLSHPALLSVGGEPRVVYYIDSSGLFSRSSATYDEQVAPEDGHGTNCAAVALGSVVDGQDSRLGTDFDRELRSGMARRALAVGVDTSGPIGLEAFLDVMHDGGELAHVLPSGLGVDVVNCSFTENEGLANAIGPRGDLVPCPTNEQNRGLDATSLAITRAYREESVVVVKSAGNTHGTGPRNAASACAVRGSAQGEVSAPGAAPAAVPVGAASIFGTTAFPQDTPAGVQQSYDLFSSSARGRTGDGRAYPLLLAQGYACGNPATTTETPAYYGQFGATSAAAPVVAGGIALFKHWYLHNHGAACANSPGRLIANALNFADGQVFAGSAPTAPRVAPPAEGWGLGLYRMRLFDDAYMGPRWHRGTTAVTVEGGFGYEFIPLGQGDRSRVPPHVARLRITAWWLEVNTGAGEEKADVALSLYDAGESGATRLAYAKADGEHVIRMQWECFGWDGARAPHGSVYLLVNCTSGVPPDARYPHREHRTVYVAWFWETGEDPSLIACGTSPVDLSPPPARAVDTGVLTTQPGAVAEDDDDGHVWLSLAWELDQHGWPFREDVDIDEGDLPRPGVL